MFKKLIAILLITVFLLSITIYPSNASMGTFMDELMQNMKGLSPKSYYSQKRGYYMGGSASVRFGFQNDQLVSFTAPKAKVGCGGIDIVMGGFSYLNFEYLVQKLQAIMSAAPAFAFQVALKTLCEQCQNVIHSLESIADMINQLNVDSCKASMAIGGYLGEQLGKAAASAMGTGSDSSWFKGLQASINEPLQKFKGWVQDVTGDIDYYACIGSGKKKEQCASQHGKVTFDPPLMTQAFSKYSAYISLTEWEPVFRAYYGDVYQNINYSWDGTALDTSSTPQIKGDPGCDTRGISILEGMVEGKYPQKTYPNTMPNVGCTYVDNEAEGLTYKVKTALQRIRNNIDSGTEPSPQDIELINSTSLPIYRLMYLARLMERIGMAYDDKLLTDVLTDRAAVMIAYEIGFSILQRIHRNISNSLSAIAALKSDTTTEVALNLTSNIVNKLENDINKYYDEMQKQREAFRQSFGDAFERERTWTQQVYSTLGKTKLLDSYLFAKGLR